MNEKLIEWGFKPAGLPKIKL